jgi:hypothetical protein
LADRAALRLYQHVARRNRILATEQNVDWQGNAIALSPTDYGK